MTARLAVLASGRGTNLQAILDACASGTLAAEVVLVGVNHEGTPAEERARRAGVPVRLFPRATRAARAAAQRALGEALRDARPDAVVLAGFDEILSDGFFAVLGDVPIVNVHPSLLPAFGGPGMLGEAVHRAVLASGARESGCSVHRVTPGPVDGGAILLQRRVPVLPGDDVHALADRVLVEEHRALVDALRALLAAREA